MGKAGENSGMAADESQKQKKRWSMKQGRRAHKFISPHWWTSVIWRMPNWRESTRNTKVEFYSEVIFRGLMQYLQNKDHQHHKWQQQKSWISYPDCQGAQDKQLTQYLLIYPGKNGRCTLARRMGSPRRDVNRRRRTREGPEPACVQTPFGASGWHTQGEEGELMSCHGTVQSAWQKPPVSREGGRAGLPVRVSGRHVVRGRQSSPILEVRPGNRQGWWKRSKFRWDGRQLTLDKTVGSRVLWHTQGSSKRPALDLGWGSPSKMAPGSLGHRPVVLLRTETAQCTVRPT